MAWMLDTNVWIKVLKKRAPLLRARIDIMDPGDILTCSLVKSELWLGALKYDDPAKRLNQIETAVSLYRSLPFDDTAARHYADIRHELEVRGERIGPNDLKIAAICLAHDLTLVSSNLREFSRVRDLRVEDWEKP